ncbi:MAG TPA: SDR family oxidoreductase [Candidatus Limnocylindrales bacterium]|nr:SDR family oxidoreductase [Candidatus Limnocylindrales bacterium]
MKLTGKNIFVTGAGSGLGAAICRLFAAEGARIAVTDIDLASATRVAAECATSTPGSIAIRCDVASSASVKDAFATFEDKLGEVDVLVNNAGIIHTNPDYLDAVQSKGQAQLAELMTDGKVSTHLDLIDRISDEMFDRMMRIHVYGTFYCTREALPRMRGRGQGGRIINMGSIMGTASLQGAPDYCAAKGAILAFTRSTAREAASYGVLINAIAPGYIDTPLLSPLEEEQKRLIAMQTPLGRLGTADEIAAAALFLAGPDSTFVTGQVLSPNGGIYMSQ